MLSHMLNIKRVGVWAGTVDIATAWQMTQAAFIGSTLRAGIAAK